MAINAASPVFLAAIVAVAATTGCAQSFRHRIIVGSYMCDGAETFSVSHTADQAFVRFGDQTYRLKRRPSSIGERFTSVGATLILDGDFAAFTADDRLRLGGCRALHGHRFAASGSNIMPAW